MEAARQAILTISCKTYSFLERYGWVILVGFSLCLMSGLVHAEETDGAKDYGAGILKGVKATFGSGSTFETVSYIAEGVICIFQYVMTQNVKWFVGLFILPIVTYAFLN